VAADSVAIDISSVVGIGPDAEQRVPALIRAIQRTVLPDTWFAVGGKGSVMPVFNSKKWFLLVFNDTDTDATVTQIKKLLDLMKM
jgi:hypothetical protein